MSRLSCCFAKLYPDMFVKLTSNDIGVLFNDKTTDDSAYLLAKQNECQLIRIFSYEDNAVSKYSEGGL